MNKNGPAAGKDSMNAPSSDDWFDPEATTFGDRLAGARDASGMSQKDLARRLGVKLKTLKGWENDLSEPRANKLSMLAGMLNVSLPWLLTGQGDGPDAPSDLTLAPDATHMLTELRDLRAHIVNASERLGRLEKSLRSHLEVRDVE